MTTIVNSPAPAQDTGVSGMLIGAIVLMGFVAIFMFFGIPAIRRMNPVQVNLPTPQVNVAAPQVNVPAPQVNVQVPPVVVPGK